MGGFCLETKAKSDGVFPPVVAGSNLVAIFTLSKAELSTTETPTTWRIDRSAEVGAKNQKLSVNPSPSESQRVLEIMFRGVSGTNSSVF